MNSDCILHEVDKLLTQLIACNRHHFDGHSKFTAAKEATSSLEEAWHSLKPQFLALRYSRTWPASFPDEAIIDELMGSSLSWKMPCADDQEVAFAAWAIKIGRCQRALMQWSGMMAAETSLRPMESAEQQISVPTKAKRSTERGEGKVKLIAALTKHHQYAGDSCLNPNPIGNNELARLAGVAESTASAFFNSEFNGRKNYRTACADGRLIMSLKMLNQEYAPHILFRGEPGEVDDED